MYRGRTFVRIIVAAFLISVAPLGCSRAQAQGNAPAVTLSVTSLTFPSTALLKSSAAMGVMLTNTGTATLSISSIGLSGGDVKDFSESDNCNGSVAASAGCTINVTFTPLLYGTRTSTLEITDNGPGSPQAVSLTGMGMGPAVSLSATTLTFGPQLATTTGAAQTVTLTNSGDEALVFAGITLTGEFTQTNNCPSGSTTLAVTSSCTFNIAFAPTAGSDQLVPGLLEIMDNASAAPQAVELIGTAQAFTLSASPASATVSPGAGATYMISVTPQGGFNAAVSFTCGSLPAGAACSFSPASVTPSGSTAATTNLTVSTTGSSSAPGPTRRVPPLGPVLGWTLWIWAILLLLVAMLAAPRARDWSRGGPPAFLLSGLALALLVTTVLVAVACGGGSSSSGSSATPSGNYTILVTGSTPAGSGTLTSPVSVTLNVD